MSGLEFSTAPAGHPGLAAPDVSVLRRSHRALAPLVRGYFRHELRGGDRIPAGQTLVVSHHDGGVLPVNNLCFVWEWHNRFAFERPLYVLTHDVLHAVSGRLARWLAGCGAVRADRDVMNAALATGASVMVMPGAARESFRPFWRRAEIDLGGRSGFVAQAIRWNLPITPVVSAGAHETLFVLNGGHTLARAMGVPRIVRSGDVWPLLAGIPWGLWALPFVPHVPLPAKITTEVLEPIVLSEALGRELKPADSEDPEVVSAGFRVVVSRMRAALKRLYAERRFPVFG